ncbi:aminopeptidase P N-terminal domain-containing protein [soil metagenome]
MHPQVWWCRRFGLIPLLLIISTAARSAEVVPTIAGQPISEYQNRRKALLERAGDVVVILGARGEDFGEFDRFRQDNDFMYLTGIERPGAMLILVPEDLSREGKPREIAFLPARIPFQERWEGRQDGPGAEAEGKFGIEEVAPTDQFYPRLISILAGPEEPTEGSDRPVVTVHTRTPRGRSTAGSKEAEFVETLRKVALRARVEDVSVHLAALRLIKSEAEVKVLQEAIDITIDAHQDAARTIRPGAFEFQVQAALEYAFARNGAERPGFFSIVGSGPNSTIPHYHANRRQIEEGDLVVVDIGAERNYYTADITRTYPASGQFTDRQRDIYQLVLDAQRAAEEAFEPGKSTMQDLQRVAQQVMRDSPLRDTQGRTMDRYFNHGLGHWLGMHVHDVGDSSKPIPNGAMFTIEPGIYIAEEELGVRIEDNYLATPEGLVKLTAALPVEADDIELMMQSRTGQPVESLQEQNGAP